jgi:hypothetical protein
MAPLAIDLDPALVQRATGQAREDFDLGELVDNTIKGFAVGFAREPVMGWLAQQAGVDPEDVANLERDIGGSTAGKVAGYVGEYGPSLLMSFGAFAGGRALATAGLRALAPRLATRGGKLGEQALNVLAHKARFIDETGHMAKLVPKPGLERAAEILGSAGGMGTFGGVEEAAMGGSPIEIAQSAAIHAALMGGFEVGVTGLGLAISPKARWWYRDPKRKAEALKVVREDIEEYLHGSPMLGGFEVGEGKVIPIFGTGERVGGKYSEMWALRKDLAEALGEAPQLRSIQDALRVKGEAEAASRLFNPNLKIPVPTSAQTKRVAELKQQLKIVERDIDEIKQYMNPEALDAGILAMAPTDPHSFRGKINRFIGPLYQTPVGAAQKLGIIGQNTVLKLDVAEAKTLLKQLMFRKRVQIMLDDLEKITGKKMKKRSWEGGGETFADEFDAWESADLSRAAKIPKYNEIEKLLDEAILPWTDDLVAIGESMGSLARMTPKQMQNRGVKRHIMHMLKWDDDPRVRQVNLTDRLKATGMTRIKAEKRAIEMMEATEREGLKSLGSLEYNRELRGTIRDLVQDPDHPLRFMDPVSAIIRYSDDVIRRTEYGRVLGWEAETQKTLAWLVDKEGGDPALFNSLMDSLTGKKYYEEASRRWAQNAVNLETVTKLTFAGIPNAFQAPVNNPLQIGWKPTVQGIYRQLLGNPQQKELGAQWAAQADDWLRAYNRIAQGAHSENWTDVAARLFLRGTFFSGTEGANKAMTAQGNNFFIRDTFARAAAGNLRGNWFDQASRRLTERGIKMDKVLNEWKASRGTLEDAVEAVHGPMAYETAIFRGTRETQFQPVRTRVPQLWATPTGRVFAQFKTFALNQAILLRDSVLAEAAMGNMRPLAYLLGIYPVAGELIGTLTYGVRAMPDPRSNGLMRAMEDMLFPGGLGIVSTIVQAAAWNRPLDALAGPTITDTTSIAAAVLRLDMDDLKYQATRQPVYQGTRSLLGATVLSLGAALEYAETVKGGGAPDETVIRLDDLLTR